MAFIQNCATEPKELEKEIMGIEIGEEVLVAEETILKLEGNLYGSDALLDGSRIQTSGVISIRRDDVDVFFARTVSGKEYEFGFTAHYGMPALNKWSFKDDLDGCIFDIVKMFKRKMDGLSPIHIKGKAADVKNCKDGSDLEVNVISFEPSENYPGVIAETKDNKRFLLPFEQRIGFYYSLAISQWHLSFDKPDKKDEESWKIIRDTVSSIISFSKKKSEYNDTFEKEEMIIPRNLKIRFESKKKTTEIIEKILSIRYKGEIRTYAIYGANENSMVEYNIYDIDKQQKKLMKRLNLVQ